MTFREQLMKFLDQEPDRFFENIVEEEDRKKYELDPKLDSEIIVLTHGPSDVIFGFDKDGNLLDLEAHIPDKSEVLRDIADHPALDEKHSGILLCSAEHIEEYESNPSAQPAKDKVYMN